MDRIRKALKKNEAFLLRLPNVVGVGLGFKEKGKQPTAEACIVVMVRKKVPRHQLAAADTIPDEVDGVATDVVEVGEVEKLESTRNS